MSDLGYHNYFASEELAEYGKWLDTLPDDAKETIKEQAQRIAELERDNANQANLLDALRETIGQMEHEARTMKSNVCGHEFEHDGWPPDELCPDCYFEKEDTDEVWYAGQEAVERQNKERAAVLSRAT